MEQHVAQLGGWLHTNRFPHRRFCYYWLWRPKFLYRNRRRAYAGIAREHGFARRGRHLRRRYPHWRPYRGFWQDIFSNYTSSLSFPGGTLIHGPDLTFDVSAASPGATLHF